MPRKTPAHPLTPHFREALTRAFNLHRHQARNGADIPYFSHLMAALVLEHSGTEDEARGVSGEGGGAGAAVAGSVGGGALSAGASLSDIRTQPGRLSTSASLGA